MTDTTLSPVGDLDVLSNVVYAEGVPHEHLAWLRDNDPIYFQTIPDERLVDEAWVLTKHAHVLEVSKDTDHFINGHGLNLRGDYSDDEGRHLLNVDDPEHLRFRRMTNKGFTPRVVRRYEDHYRDMAGGLFDDAITKGRQSDSSTTFDAVEELSIALPLMAICELLGTAPDDRDQLVAWSNAIITNDDPEYSPSAEARAQAGAEFFEYIAELERDRRASPQDDMATQLVQTLDAGDLAPEEFASYVSLLFIAGNETTRNNISHGIDQLARNPEQLRLLRDGGDETLDLAVEEITRWASPVIYMSRTVTKDVDFHGARFKAGDKVVLHYASANHDTDVFTDPFDFDVTRDPNPHLSFGFGAHFCLGAHLARLETRCLLQELITRVDSLELAGPVEYVRSSFIHGIKRLPVRITTR